MSILKVRGLADVGVVADIDPYDLPPGAWSFAVNADFSGKQVQRAPVWRKADTLDTTDPRFTFVRRGSEGSDDLFVGYKNGKVYKWANAAETDYSKSGYIPSSVEATWTSCSLADVTFVNRSDRAPWALIPGGTAFVAVTGWDAGWTTKLLRAYAGAVVALNVTKSGTSHPTLVKTSDIVDTTGSMPSTWDETDPTNNATENTLTELQGAITDACVLGDSLIIYGTTQNFEMRADGSADVYAYRRLPFDGGAINANCSVEVDGKHFVFGPNDIYAHDGISKVSVVDQKNREFIYQSINAAKASKFFVNYNSNRKTLAFHYVGTDQHVAFSGGSGCNRIFTLHVPSGKQWFEDAPLVFGAVMSSMSIDALTWASVTSTWDTIGGSWQDLDDGLKKAPVYVGELEATIGLTTSLYINDPYGRGSVVSAPVDTVATAPVYMERLGIDLDEVNADLRGYKQIVSIYPQGRVEPDGEPFQFSFGVSDTFGTDPVYSDYQDYDPRIDYKLDFDEAGRYLTMRVLYDDYKTFSLTGIDLDVEILSDGP